MRERIPHGDEDLRAHQVDPGDLFGNGVFDLDAGIDLDEEDLFLLVHQKFHRAGIAVVDRPGQLQCVSIQAVFGFLRHRQAGSDLHDFLKTALHGAVALVEVHHIPVLIPEDLHLDVLGVFNVLLEEHGRIAKGSTGLSPRLFVFPDQLRRISHDPHAPTAAAGCRLDHERIPDALGLAQGRLRRIEGHAAIPDQGHVQRPGQFFGRHLVAQAFHDLGAGSDKDDPFFAATPGKTHVLGKEPVAGMDRIDLGGLGNTQDLFHIEIGLERIVVGADLVALIGLVAVQGVAIFEGVDRHGAKVQFGSGAQYADGDLAAIGDQQFLKTVRLAFHVERGFWRTVRASRSYQKDRRNEISGLLRKEIMRVDRGKGPGIPVS